VDVELARQQWQDGYRRLEEARPNRPRYKRMLKQVEAVTAELRQRIGQTFTLEELTAAYSQADDWTREAAERADEEAGAVEEASTIGDAAFHLYARGAADYAP
jgi:hypothetical protein